MTVTANDNRRSYAGDGTTNPWSFPIYFISSGDLKVIRRAADGTETTLVIATDYTVSGAGNPAGGSVTPVAATVVGATYVIYRDPPLTQVFTATDGSKLPIASLVQALDKIVMLTQRLYERVGRSLRLKESDTDGSGRYDANGNRFVNAAAPVDANDLITKTWAENTLVVGAGKVSGLATVATTGAYADLSGRPTLGTAAALNTGTASGNIPLLGASGLPAVGGSLLTGLTKSQVSLGNVDNTADIAKPISTATQTALNAKADTSSLGTAATLNVGTASGNIPQLGASGLPAVGGSLLTGLTKSQVALGNVDNTSDATKNAATATLTNKTLTSPVINSPTGLVKSDVALGNVDNTSDANKPVSTATQAALDAKAPLNSPVLVTPTLSARPATSDNSALIPDTKWVNDAISGAVSSGVADGDKGDIVVSSSGTVWTLDSGTTSALKDRANHTGFQLAATISDFASSTDARITSALGVTVQAYSANLATWSGVAPGTGVATFLASPTSANLRAALTDETGTGSAVFATSPTLTTPNLGTPSAVTLTNGTGLPFAGLDASGVATAYLVGRIASSGSNGTVAVSSSATNNTVPYRDGTGLFNVGTATGSAHPVTKAQMDAVTAASAQLAVEDQVITGGARVTSKGLGTITTGTVTPDPGDRPIQDYTNNGAHTLAPGSNYGYYLIDIVNGATAGAITTSGWTKVVGDAFTTSNGDKFRCGASVTANGALLTVQALQ